MLHKLTCNVEQSQALISLGIAKVSLISHYKVLDEWQTIPTGSAVNFTEAWPAWTKAELDAMIGPKYEKPDLWKEERITRFTDPHTYPVFTLESVIAYDNGAVASAAGLILLLERKFVLPIEADKRYELIFQR